jgi:hypothetical protein
VTLRGTSAMRGCIGFFMGNSLSDLRNRLIPFFGKFASKLPITPFQDSC